MLDEYGYSNRPGFCLTISSRTIEAIRRWFNRRRGGVCVELIFWLGFKGFKGFTETNKALATGDYRLAALELYNSNLGKDPLLRGRARALAEILWEGQANG